MKNALKILLSACAAAALSAVALALASLPPADFKPGAIVVVPKGATLSETADALARQRVIRSEYLFKAGVVLLAGRSGIKAGSYLFASPISGLKVAQRIASGDQQLPAIKITVPEGLDSSEIAAIIGRSIPGFDAAAFLGIAKAQEGYLFPDTYFFYQNTTPEEAAAAMRADFDRRTAAIAEPVLTFVRQSSSTPSDILKMASIVEKEATSTADRKIVAGILWKRIRTGMPLQVDPPFEYFLGKASSKLTADDLKADSPYNLYLHKGLPPTPIDSPGIDAILATVSPTDTKYWFYLSDAHGVMRYATDLEGHIANRQKYLDK